MQKKISLASAVSALLFLNCCGHVTVTNKEICSVAGRIQFGGICAETHTETTRDLTYIELMDMLEAQEDRPDPQDATRVLPAHGAAIIMTTADFGSFKTELEVACRLLKSKCSYEVQQAIGAAFYRLEKAISRLEQVQTLRMQSR